MWLISEYMITISPLSKTSKCFCEKAESTCVLSKRNCSGPYVD